MSAQRILDLTSTFRDPARRSKCRPGVASCPVSSFGLQRYDSQLGVSLAHQGPFPIQARSFAAYAHFLHALFLGARRIPRAGRYPSDLDSVRQWNPVKVTMGVRVAQLGVLALLSACTAGLEAVPPAGEMARSKVVDVYESPELRAYGLAAQPPGNWERSEGSVAWGAASRGRCARSNVLAANAMFRSGIRVYLYPGVSHVKAAIYDGWACLGSANLDKLSLRVNKELNLATSHRETVQALEQQLFDPDFEKSTEMTRPLEEHWSYCLAELLADQL